MKFKENQHFYSPFKQCKDSNHHPLLLTWGIVAWHIPAAYLLTISQLQSFLLYSTLLSAGTLRNIFPRLRCSLTAYCVLLLGLQNGSERWEKRKTTFLPIVPVLVSVAHSSFTGPAFTFFKTPLALAISLRATSILQWHPLWNVQVEAYCKWENEWVKNASKVSNQI